MNNFKKIIIFALIIFVPLILVFYFYNNKKEVVNSELVTTYNDFDKKIDNKKPIKQFSNIGNDIDDFILENYSLGKIFYEDINKDKNKDIIAEIVTKSDGFEKSIIIIAIKKENNYNLIYSFDKLGITDFKAEELLSLDLVENGIITVSSKTFSIGADAKSTQTFKLIDNELFCTTEYRKFNHRGIDIDEYYYDYENGTGKRKEFNFFEDEIENKNEPLFIEYNIKVKKPFNLKYHLEKTDYSDKFIQSKLTEKTKLNDLLKAGINIKDLNNIDFYNCYYSDEKYLIFDIYMKGKNRLLICLYDRKNDIITIFRDESENSNINFDINENKIYYFYNEFNKGLLIGFYDLKNFEENILFNEQFEEIYLIDFFQNELIFKVGNLYSKIYRFDLNNLGLELIGNIKSFN